MHFLVGLILMAYCVLIKPLFCCFHFFKLYFKDIDIFYKKTTEGMKSKI
jgi:hypothetical protein